MLLLLFTLLLFCLSYCHCNCCAVMRSKVGVSQSSNCWLQYSTGFPRFVSPYDNWCLCHHMITGLTCLVAWLSSPLTYTCTHTHTHTHTHTQRLIHRHASFFFIPLASQLINDESPTCRQMVAEAMKTLVGRVRVSFLRWNCPHVCVVGVWILSCVPPYSLTLLRGMILRAWLNCGSVMIRYAFLLFVPVSKNTAINNFW